MTEVACEGEEIWRLEELVPLLLAVLLLLLLLLELLVREVGDVDAEEEEEKAVFAFSAALFRTILWMRGVYRFERSTEDGDGDHREQSSTH